MHNKIQNAGEQLCADGRSGLLGRLVHRVRFFLVRRELPGRRLALHVVEVLVEAGVPQTVPVIHAHPDPAAHETELRPLDP